MHETLAEIITIAKKALATAEDKVIDTKVETINKNSFVSIGGSLDSIILLAENVKQDPHMDNIDRTEKHNIAGGMNSPSERQVEAYKKDNE